MKKEVSSQIMIPHIMVLEDIENVKKIDFNELSYVMFNILDDIIEDEEENEPETFGLLVANFHGLNYSEEDATALCWHSNIYNISSELQYGTAKRGDLTKVEERLSEHLIITSLNLSLDDQNKEFGEAFQSGIFDIKLGSGKTKRSYRITYELIDSNMEEAFEKCQEYIQENHVPEKRVLH